ncbi:hypothetical protein SAMN05444392_106131 [Seinonella peptonophila]|uniref:Uncharacterized protein n=1 Tax=Seinonella peptonophila TaxID=112248 RepID=A0A1M4YB25_9BACL|nr:hypothetical protein SAMN05444392_106131 [Seinonella peptonophila]
MLLDVAYLYCFSLLVPEMAEKVYQTFAEILDNESGRVAILYAATRIFRRIKQGDFVELERPLKRVGREIVDL